MKNLKLYIKESLLDDEDILMKDTGDEAIKNEIQEYLKENYKGRCKISKTPINGKYVVDCHEMLRVKNKNITSLTNGSFEFGVVNGNFSCMGCESLTSLEGAPKEVHGYFDCSFCNSLKSLEGSPKKLFNGCFDCGSCKSLTSLKGAPKEVEGSFYCNDCNSLTSLKGAPKEVGGSFYCHNCKTKFTDEHVMKVSNVKNIILAY